MKERVNEAMDRELREFYRMYADENISKEELNWAVVGMGAILQHFTNYSMLTFAERFSIPEQNYINK